MIGTRWRGDVSKDTKEFIAFERTVRASLKIPGTELHHYRDAETMGHAVAAELDDRIVRQIAEHVVEQLGRVAGLGSTEFLAFVRFLGSDPELRDRFTAYKTAKRLRGE